MDDRNKARAVAIVITLFIVIAVVTLMLWITLRYTGKRPVKWPPEDTSELLMDGEYVKYGDIPEPLQEEQEQAPESSSDALIEGEDMIDEGQPVSETQPPVASNVESPMKMNEKPKPEKTGPSAAEKAEQEKIRQQQETASRINSRVNFGGTQSGSSATGSSGSPNGNSSQGVLSGTPGSNVKGRTLSNWSKPKGVAAGSIVVYVVVNRQGKVIKASYSHGSGPVAADKEARKNCVQAALGSSFSVDLDASAEQTGTITYHFE